MAFVNAKQQLEATEITGKLSPRRNSADRKNVDCTFLDIARSNARSKSPTPVESENSDNEAVTLYSWKANGNQLILHTTKKPKSRDSSISSNPGSSTDETIDSPREIRKIKLMNDINEIKSSENEPQNLNKTRSNTPVPTEVKLQPNDDNIRPVTPIKNVEDMRAVSPAFIKNEECVSVESPSMKRRTPRVRDDSVDGETEQRKPTNYSDRYKVEQKSLGAAGEVISFERKKQVVRKLSNIINDTYTNISNTDVNFKSVPSDTSGDQLSANKLQTNLEERNVSISVQPTAVVIEDENYEAPSKRILTCHSRKGMVYVKRKSDPTTVPRKPYMVQLVTVYDGKTVKTLTVYDGDVGCDDTLTLILPIKPGDPADDTLMDEVTVEETHENQTTLKSTKYIQEKKIPSKPRTSPLLKGRTSNSSLEQRKSADRLKQTPHLSNSSIQLGKKTPSDDKQNSNIILQKNSSQSLGTPTRKVPISKVQIGIAPPPNIKVATSKINSLPVKPKSAVDPRTSNTDTPIIDKKIVNMKLKWNAGSKIDSFSNANYKSSGGNKKVIENKRTNYNSVTPRIESRNMYSQQGSANSNSSSGQSSVTSRPSTSSIRWKF